MPCMEPSSNCCLPLGVAQSGVEFCAVALVAVVNDLPGGLHEIPTKMVQRLCADQEVHTSQNPQRLSRNRNTKIKIMLMFNNNNH